MTANQFSPPKVPCGSCPYRRDVPAGIWDRIEYEKLRDYDKETWMQPLGLFLCHQKDGCICGGWLLTHDRDHLLALRVHRESLDPAVWTYEADVEVFPSGEAAARHGISGIKRPSPAALRKMQGIQRLRDIAGSKS